LPQLLTLARGRVSIAIPCLPALRARLLEALFVLLPEALGRPSRHRRVPMGRLLCNFPLLLRRPLERSEPFAEPSLAELSSHEGSLHPHAALYVLEDQPVAVRANHNAKAAAEVVHVVPASQLGRVKSRPKLFPVPAREAFDCMVGFAVCISLRDPLALARPRPKGCLAELPFEGPGPGEELLSGGPKRASESERSLDGSY